eukprot:11340-Heterococcus_DN1.PRE.1
MKAYGYAISAAAQGKRWEQALCLLRSLAETGARPNIVCYNSAIKAACMQCQGSASLVAAMYTRRCSTQKPSTTHSNSSTTIKTAAAHTQQALPDVHTYAEALTACALDNRVDRALAILKEMPDVGVQPNAVCYNVAIRACDKAGRWQQALDLVHTMECNDVAPDVSTYTAAMTCCNNAKKWQYALQLWEAMKQRVRTTPINSGSTASRPTNSNRHSSSSSSSSYDSSSSSSGGSLKFRPRPCVPVVPNVQAYGACIQ